MYIICITVRRTVITTVLVATVVIFVGIVFVAVIVVGSAFDKEIFSTSFTCFFKLSFSLCSNAFWWWHSLTLQNLIKTFFQKLQEFIMHVSCWSLKYTQIIRRSLILLMSPLPKGTFIQVSQTWMKVWGLQLYLKRDSQVFSCEFCEISKNTYFKEHLWTISFKRWTCEISQPYRTTIFIVT